MDENGVMSPTGLLLTDVSIPTTAQEMNSL